MDHCLDEIALLVGGDALVALLKFCWELKGYRVARLQDTQKWRKNRLAHVALLRRFDHDWTTGKADVAEPRLIELLRIRIQWRVEAGEMEGSVASVTAEQITTAIAGFAIVVVHGPLGVIC